MSPKTAIYLGIAIGSTVGGFIPSLWGAQAFSFSALTFSAVGAIVGIFVAFKMTHS